jgi:hypothetical protein
MEVGAKTRRSPPTGISTATFWMGPKIADTIGHLASSLLRVLETSNFEERLARLEAALKARKTGGTLVQSTAVEHSLPKRGKLQSVHPQV